ncbi:MAG: hypothetical protein ACK5V3_14125 [Bdellovibrionales bacterium]
MKKAAFLILTVLLLIVGGGVTIKFWSYIFAKDVEGQIIKVERLVDPMAVAVMGNGTGPSSKVFSFAVAVKDSQSGEIMTGSTEDRQWAAVDGEGFCAQARFFPYPPWQFDKAGTYFGVRLLKMWSCADSKPQ